MFSKAMRLVLSGLLTAGLLLALFLLADRLWPVPVEELQDRTRVVLDRNGDWLFAEPNSRKRWRLAADAEEVDPGFIRVLLHYEDKRFHLHPGADPLAIARAIGQAIINGKVVSGASTLTMQVARMLERRPRTMSAKLIETFRAFQLEWHYSKKEILGFYLTLAPYGGNLEGIEAGSRAWLGKSPRVLTLAESALLTVLPQRPAKLRPDRYPVAAKKARDKVLKRMLDGGLITRQQFQEATSVALPARRNYFPRHAPHHSMALLHTQTGMVQSTIDRSLQQQLETLAREHAFKWEDGVTMAALVMDNSTGQIRAHIGSHDRHSNRVSGYLDMARATRSPGSALKPFIYGLAFDQGQLHPETIMTDLPRSFGTYTPTNFDGTYSGEVTVIEALQQSLNIPAVAVLERVGPARLVEQLHEAGLDLVTADERPSLPIALGGTGVTLEQLVRLYRNLANMNQGAGMQSGIAVMGKRSARWITAILAQNPVPAGFYSGKNHAAWKTGTSYGYRDAWTIGYNGDYTVGVWVGRPDGNPRQGNRQETIGRRAAAPVFFEIMQLLPRRTKLYTASGYGELPATLARFNREDQLMAERLELRLLSGSNHVRSVKACGKVVLELSATHGEKPFHWFMNGHHLGKTEVPRHRLNILEPGNLALKVMDGRYRTASLAVWVEGDSCL